MLGAGSATNLSDQHILLLNLKKFNYKFPYLILKE